MRNRGAPKSDGATPAPTQAPAVAAPQAPDPTRKPPDEGATSAATSEERVARERSVAAGSEARLGDYGSAILRG